MNLRNLLHRDSVIGAITALMVALIINLPLWHALMFTDELSRLDIVTESTDEEFYLTRIREASDGHPWLGHPYVYELRNQRYPLGNLIETAMGVPMRWFGLSIKTTSIIGDAIFPFLLAFILWHAAAPLLRDRRWRAVLIGMTLLGADMIWWKRPVSHQATTVLPLLYLWALLSPKRDELWLCAIRGALIGLMTLSYPFHWTFTIVAEGLYLLSSMAKKRDMTSIIIRPLTVAVPLLLCALPWLILSFQMRGDIDYAALLERLGLIDRRLPTGPLLQVQLLAVIALTWWAGRTKTETRPLLVLLFAGLAVLNLPLLTGKEAEFAAHYRMIILFPLWIALLASLHAIATRWPRAVTIIPVVLLVIIGARTAEVSLNQWEQFEAKRTDTAVRERQVRLMTLLHTLPDEQVILMDDALSRQLTVYTSHYPFWLFETHMYLIDQREIIKRAAVHQAVFPSYAVPYRAVIGSSYLNKALYSVLVCRMQLRLGFTDKTCVNAPETFVDMELLTPLTITPSPQEEVLSALKNAHVTYALLQTTPEWMSPHVTPIGTTDGYTLLRFAD